MGFIEPALLVMVFLVGGYFAELTPEERAARDASEEARRAEPEARRAARRRPVSMTRGLLLILAVPLALAGVKYIIAPVVLFHAVTTADSYPSFMADFHPPRLYADLGRSFDEFIRRRFPVRSNAQDAMAKISLEGFRVVSSREGLQRFIFNHHAGPCGEYYSIALRQNSDSTIAEISGEVNVHCL